MTSPSPPLGGSNVFLAAFPGSLALTRGYASGVMESRSIAVEKATKKLGRVHPSIRPLPEKGPRRDQAKAKCIAHLTKK